MKKLIAAFVLALSLGLSGCTMFEPLHAKESIESATVTATRRTIDEGYGMVISLNRVIIANVKAGIWTPEQAQQYLDESKRARESLDKALNLLYMGDLTSAKTQAEAIKFALIELQRHAAAAARKGG